MDWFHGLDPASVENDGMHILDIAYDFGVVVLLTAVVIVELIISTHVEAQLDTAAAAKAAVGGSHAGAAGNSLKVSFSTAHRQQQQQVQSCQSLRQLHVCHGWLWAMRRQVEDDQVRWATHHMRKQCPLPPTISDLLR
jgi:hypothetical protein